MTNEGLVFDVEFNSNQAVHNANALNNAMQEVRRNASSTRNSFTDTRKTVSSFSSGIKNATGILTIFTSALAVVGGVRGLIGLAKQFISTANATEQYNTRLEILLGSTEEASKLFNEMTVYASKVPFTYDKIMESATALSGVMKGGVEEITEWMPMIGDLAAASGLSIEQTTQQIIRMYSAGAGAADLFRERGVLAMMGFTAGVSYSTEETKKMMKDSWNSVNSQFKGATDKLATTWEGMISMLSDRWFAFKDLVMKSGVFDIIKEGVSLFIKRIDELSASGELRVWAKQTATVVVDSFRLMTKASSFFIDKASAVLSGWIKAYGAVASLMAKSKIASFDLGITTLEIQIKKVQSKLLATEKETEKVFGDVSRRIAEHTNKIKQLNEERKKLVLKKEPYVESLKAFSDMGKTAENIRKLGKNASTAFDAIAAKIKEIQINVNKNNKSTKETVKVTKDLVKSTKKTVKVTKDLVKSTKKTVKVTKDLVKPTEDVGKEWKVNIDYITAINNQLTNMKSKNKEIVSSIKPTTLLNINDFNEFLDKVDIIQEAFNTLGESITDSFGEAFKDIIKTGEIDFKKLGNSIKDTFIDITVDLAKKKLFEPIVNSAMDSLQDMFGKAFSSISGSLPKTGEIAGGLGAATMGFGAGQALGQTGIGTALGAGVGFIGGGPVGAVAGAIVGTATEELISMITGLSFGSEKLKKRINFVFETLEDSITFIGNKWNLSENEREIVKAIENTFQTQLDFYNRITDITDQEISSMTIGFSSLEHLISNLSSGIESAFILSTDAFDKLSEVFPTFTEEYTKIFETTFKDMHNELIHRIGGAAQVSNDVMDSIVAAISGPKGKGLGEFQDLLASFNPEELTNVLNNVYIKLKDATGKNVQVFLADLVNSEDWNTFFSDFQKEFENIFQNISSMVGNAFMSSIETADYQNFIKTVNQNFRDSIKQSLAQAFSKRLTEEIFMNSGIFGTTGILSQYAKGDVSAVEVQQSLTTSLNELNSLLPTLEPIWNEIGGILQQVDSTLNITNSNLADNNEAIFDNTSAIIGPVNDFLTYLSGKSNGGMLDIANITNTFNDLYKNAQTSVEGFNTWSNYFKNTVEPTIENTPDFSSIIESVRQQTLALPNYQAAVASNTDTNTNNTDTNTNTNSGNNYFKVQIGTTELKDIMVEQIQEPDFKQALAA